MHSWEMERSFSAVPPLKIIPHWKELLNIDHQSNIDGTQRQKAKQWEGKAIGLCNNYFLTFRSFFDELAVVGSYHLLQSVLTL